jgi:hypothetical protein
MNCGGANRFSCGITRMAKHKSSLPDRPSNQQLHNDNEKKLDEMLRIREQQNNGIFSSISQQNTKNTK